MRLPEGKWARDYDACVICNRTDIPHNSRGRCSTCARREWAKANPEKDQANEKAKRIRNAEKIYALTSAWRKKNRRRTRELQKADRERYKAEHGVTRHARFIPGRSMKHPVAGWVEILRPAYQKGATNWFVLVKNKHGETIEVRTKEFQTEPGATYRKGEQTQ